MSVSPKQSPGREGIQMIPAICVTETLAWQWSATTAMPSTHSGGLGHERMLHGRRLRNRNLQHNKRDKSKITATLIVPNTGSKALERVEGRKARQGYDGSGAKKGYVGRRDRYSDTKELTTRKELDDDVQETVVAAMTTEERVRLTLTRDGQVSLWEEGDPPRLVSVSSLSLPELCRGMVPCVVQKKKDRGRNADEMTVRWGPKESPLAILEVSGHHVKGNHGWSEKMSKGFVLEFKVAADLAPSTGAEISVHLEPSGHWFGGGHFIRQIWPLNDASLEVGPWYAFDNGPNGVNNLVGAHWMTSCGLLVSVDPSAQYLHIGMNAPKKTKKEWKSRKWGVGIQNATRELLPLTKGHGKVARAGQDGLLRIQARSNYQDARMEHPLRHWQHYSDEFGDDVYNEEDMLSVRVAMSVTKDAAEACQMALRAMNPPKQAPALSLFKSPIWTTWARYKTKVTQEKVLRYAQEIVDRGLPRSVMEIDDRWQVAYGDLSFDLKKFPDPVGMVDKLHDMGFSVTTWVHPFVEKKSEAFLEGAKHGFFVGCDMADHPHHEGPFGWFLNKKYNQDDADIMGGAGGSKVGFFSWWNTPPVAALDVTNPDAVEWFVSRLRELQEKTGVDGFKFDAGEPCFLPRKPRTHTPMSTPAEYTQLYVQRVAGQFAGGVSEVRTGHCTQDVALMYRMGDRFSTWDAGNGLRSLIPTLLTSGVLGYPFCLPDMIGGNAYFNTFPDKELLVRWTQVNALMPAMQFSLAPWDIGGDTEKLVAKALQVRSRLEDYLIKLASEAAHTLEPICRPLWMLSPDEEATYEIQDQFALGNDIIVAPVVYRGARQRDIYLTKGTWRDLMDGSCIEGGRWIRNVASPLEHLPVYVREGMTGIRW